MIESMLDNACRRVSIQLDQLLWSHMRCAGIPSRPMFPSLFGSASDTSGSMALSSSRQSFQTCASSALISVIAIASWTTSASSVAILSGDDASTCRLLGVAERDRPDDEVASYNPVLDILCDINDSTHIAHSVC